MQLPDVINKPRAMIRRGFRWAGRKWYMRQLGKPLQVTYSRDDILSKGYYSQDGQDVFVVERLFDQKRGGVFIDVGANDGVTFSNSYYLEKQLGWSGLALEPIPGTYEKLRASRKCICEQVCAAERCGEARFQCVPGGGEMLSGLVEYQAQQHKRRIASYVRDSQSQEISVRCVRLGDIAMQYNMTAIDFLSIDTEGSELAVLKGVDWDRMQIAAIAVENNYYSLGICHFLRDRGYVCIARFNNDELYIQPDSFTQFAS